MANPNTAGRYYAKNPWTNLGQRGDYSAYSLEKELKALGQYDEYKVTRKRMGSRKERSKSWWVYTVWGRNK